jgi:hypothetical protein
MSRKRLHGLAKALGATALALALLATFLAYAQPTLMIQLSEQLWACF